MLNTEIAGIDPTWLEARVPPSLRGSVAGLEVWQWLGLLVSVVLSYVIGRGIHHVLVRVALQITRRSVATWDDALLDGLRRPLRFALWVVILIATSSMLALPSGFVAALSRAGGIVLVAAVGWTVIRLVGVIAGYIELRATAAASAGPEAELASRGLRTHVRVLSRVASVCIGIITIALMLMRFEIVRNVGVSLLASAGLAGVVLGFAAQRTFGSLIAGIQLSATQPIRIGDVVIIEKEWGVIEEITLTYVVVKIWDERRLVVPVTRFLEHPFENWTKGSAELHGAVFLYVDWTLPVDELRKEAERIIEAHPLWDGRTKSVQVTAAKEQTIEVRVLVSASDASKMWTLRTQVREELVRWLQTYEGGRCLPRLRLEQGSTGPIARSANVST